MDSSIPPLSDLGKEVEKGGGEEQEEGKEKKRNRRGSRRRLTARVQHSNTYDRPSNTPSGWERSRERRWRRRGIGEGRDGQLINTPNRQRAGNEVEEGGGEEEEEEE